MSDVRKCDGPGCNKESPLDDPVGGVSLTGDNPSANDYIVLECKMGITYHFHKDACLTAWVKKETTVANGD